MTVEIAQSVLILISITVTEGNHSLIVFLGERIGKTYTGHPELAVPCLEGDQGLDTNLTLP